MWLVWDIIGSICIGVGATNLLVMLSDMVSGDYERWKK